MSQTIFTTIDPADSGTDLATILNNFKDAVVSGFSGTSRPTNLQAGGYWIDTTNDPTSWGFVLWTGVADVVVFTIDLATGTAAVSLAVDSFSIKKVSVDTVGAALELVKRRIASSGQVLSGDTVSEIRAVGRDNTGANPVVAKIVFEAADNMTSSAFGGVLNFYSTPQGSATASVHMRFIAGIVETLVPLKVNSGILASQNVATTATITQLSGAKTLVEMTGSTATDIQGINSAQDSKVISIHNRSSANVTLKHQNAGATAADRMLLPEASDIVLLPQDTVTLYYCVTDSRWKALHANFRFDGFTSEKFYASAGSWTAPLSTNKVRVVAHSKSSSMNKEKSSVRAFVALDIIGSAYVTGINANGELGVGDVVPRSSPVAVLGGLRFVEVELAGSASTGHSLAITEDGTAYAWGRNILGQLGVGDVVPRSSPVAVLGGLKFKAIKSSSASSMGITSDGTAYAWGFNANGELGVGDVVPRSSPVAVLGGLKFREAVSCGFSLGRAFGIGLDGSLYAWGLNANGELGVGDVVPRSSPVAVLGGLKFKQVKVNDSSTFAITESGDLYAWGLNTNGGLGVGDVVPRSSPVAVLGGLKFRDIFLDHKSTTSHVVGITETGAAYVWGLNDSGQLGLGDVVPRSSPVAVLGGISWNKVSVSEDSVVGISADGVAYAWGLNSNGQLGLNDVIPRSSPVAVLGGLVFQEIYGTNDLPGSGFFGTSINGKIYAWGANASGQLGLGDVIPRSSPVAVLGGLQLKNQDDSTTVIDIAVVGGDIYPIKMGAGPCFFGSQPIGNNIQKVEISYI